MNPHTITSENLKIKLRSNNRLFGVGVNLLIFTNKFDENDDLLGFFPKWVYALLDHFGKITVITQYVGSYKKNEKLKVLLIKKSSPFLLRILKFYSYLWFLRKEYSSAFILMAPLWMIFAGPALKLLNKKSILWYAVWKKSFKLRLAAFGADRIIASVPEAFPYKSRKLTTVGQGIDTDFFKPNSSEKNKNSVLFLGRISPIKKIEFLIAALKEVPETKLRIAGGPVNPGDSDYLEKLKKLTDSSKLSSRVEFIGKISHDKTPILYQRADVFVNLTPTGSFDKTMLEAMASGCLVLSANEALRRFLSEDISRGILLSADLADLPAKLKNLINLPDSEKEKIRLELRKMVLGSHSIKTMIPKLASVIKGSVSHRTTTNKILISGFSYAYPYYFKVFEHFKNKENLFFILPKLWVARQGKIRLRLEKKPGFNIIGAKAVSFGGSSLLWKFGGLLKGFMPAVLFLIPYFKFIKKVNVYYHISEPHLLTTFLNALTAKIFNLKYICFTWQNLEPEERLKGLKLKLSNFFVRLNLSLSDAIMCGSIKSEQVIGKIKPSMRTVNIPMAGIDTERFKPALVRKNSKEKLILFFGALDHRKGVDILIKAFHLIKNRFPDAKLLIVGSGFEEEKLKSLANDLNLGDRIEFRSWMKNEELPSVIQQSDVFVYLSRRSDGWIEQLGYAIMQVSAAGMPVVATDNGSIDEVIIDGKGGFLVKPDNVDETAEAIAKILENPELAKRMSEFGHKYINDNFSHTVVAEKMESFLQNF